MLLVMKFYNAQKKIIFLTYLQCQLRLRFVKVDIISLKSGT